LLSAILHSFGITNLDPAKLLASTPGKIFQSKNAQILFDRNKLLIRKLELLGEQEILISHFPDTITAGKTKFSFELVNINKLPSIPFDNDIHVLDAGKIRMPLTLRKWLPGDAFYPLGMRKKKKISDFLIDRKVNRFEKELTYVLLSGQDIVCILGHRIDDRFKLTDETNSVLYITQIHD
jgi:tRNA(Ile)-lysidine synthase